MLIPYYSKKFPPGISIERRAKGGSDTTGERREGTEIGGGILLMDYNKRFFEHKTRARARTRSHLAMATGTNSGLFCSDVKVAEVFPG
jgi:hypothetical protein